MTRNSHICNILSPIRGARSLLGYPGPFYLLFTPSNSPVLHSGWFSDLYLACFSNYCWFSKLDPLLTQNSYMLIHPQHDRVKQILAGLCTLFSTLNLYLIAICIFKAGGKSYYFLYLIFDDFLFNYSLIKKSMVFFAKNWLLAYAFYAFFIKLSLETFLLLNTGCYWNKRIKYFKNN